MLPLNTWRLASHRAPDGDVESQLTNNFIIRKIALLVGVRSIEEHWGPYSSPLLQFAVSTSLIKNWEGGMKNQNVEPCQMRLYDLSKCMGVSEMGTVERAVLKGSFVGRMY